VTAALAMFVVAGVLLALETPIAAALGASAVVGLLVFTSVPLDVLASQMCGALDNWNLLAIPFFVIAGAVLGETGISRRLVALASALVGRMAGGLAIVTIVVSVFFAGISGSGPADVAAIGLVLIPAMVAAGYGRGFSAAIMAAGGGLGIIIPPSIALILFGVCAPANIRALFLAGVLPGLLVAGALIAYVAWRFRGWKPCEESVPPPPLGRALAQASWGLLAPVIILGGIYSGLFTPTESAAVAVMYALAVDALVYHELTWPALWRLLGDGAVTSAKVLIVVACASLFAFVMGVKCVPQQAAQWIGGMNLSPWILLLAINGALLAAGCFLDAVSIIYVLTPILMPMVSAAGIDPVHFGVIMIVNLAIGQITPPVGVNLFVACGISRAPLNEVSRAVIPIVLVEIAALAVITYVPWLSLILPKLLP